MTRFMEIPDEQPGVMLGKLDGPDGETPMTAGPTDKPEGARLGWTVLESSEPFASPWLRLRQDRIRIAGKGEITYTYIPAPPAVFVVPVTADRKILLIRQYRYPPDTWCLEIPAGGTHDRAEMSLEDNARQELREEIGAICDRLVHAGSFYVAGSKTDQTCEIYVALNTRIVDHPEPEITEQIEVHVVPAATALSLARTGQIKEGQSALALLLSERLLVQYGIITLDDIAQSLGAAG